MDERTARVAAPVVFGFFVVLAVAQSPHSAAPAIAGGAVAFGLGGLVAVRRATGWAAAVGLAMAAAAVFVVCWCESSNLGWFAICALGGWIAWVSGRVAAGLFCLAAGAGFGVQWLQQPDEPGWGAWVAGTLFTVVASVFAQRQRALLAQLQEAQAGLAARAAAEERNRIAHELHDVIGHALTVSLLHVTSARLALDEDPAEAAASLAEAERLAQQSLAEVRAVVGLMKDAVDSGPLPGAAQLDDLVASFVRAGADIDWSVAGDPATLTATEGLIVYRILQEALTNVARHAPGSPVTARLTVDSRRTVVRVDSGGAPGPHSGESVGEGTGLAGMRQRAETLGGDLTAGPHAGGWRVEAVLPS